MPGCERSTPTDDLCVELVYGETKDEQAVLRHALPMEYVSVKMMARIVMICN
ncbi:hypothetical protein [Dictyobacter vulcani]|uniref:hypothetical protein n=1 Tax=Dictyobacter vulcani TaxID=2607529 RepID=UPI001386C5E7|nr:hypothetical protein [Dictyobacter vulcani]